MVQELSEHEYNLLEEISAEQLMEYNTNIAAYIRDSGTEEELKAFQYIQDELQKLGIATELSFSDGYISLPKSARLCVKGKEYPCLTHSMSTNVTDLQAEVVYVGKGKAEDYQGKNVAGKIVVVEGLCMGVPVLNAQNHGAVGIIFLNDEHIHNMIGSRIWGSPSIEDYEILPKIAFLSVNSFSAAEIREALEQGRVEACMSTVVETRWRRLPTLVGNIMGKEHPEKYLMLSNHVDSWVYGAMDNGSANAALMHVMKTLKQHEQELKRSVKICFWSGHSHGRYAGSTNYCDAHFEDLYENCFLHINADSLGAQGSDILTEANCMAETKGLAAPIIKAVAQQDYNGSRYGRAGDQSFWGTGIPSLFMGLSEQPIGEGTAAKSFAELMGNGKTGGFGWWWHSSEDTIDKIDPQRLARDCRIYLLVAYRSLTDVYLPIEQEKAAAELVEILQKYAQAVQDKADLSVTLARAKELQQLTRELADLKEKFTPDQYNDYLMAMSRILVTLNYVEGSRFEHDLAVRGKDIPMLSVLDEYQKVAKDTDGWRLVNVVAVRRLNRANFYLKQGIDLAKRYLAILD